MISSFVTWATGEAVGDMSEANFLLFSMYRKLLYVLNNINQTIIIVRDVMKLRR